jgi:hypothetical protein
LPVYMTLGESPEGDFDIRTDVQKDNEEIRNQYKSFTFIYLCDTLCEEFYTSDLLFALWNL